MRPKYARQALDYPIVPLVPLRTCQSGNSHKNFLSIYFMAIKQVNRLRSRTESRINGIRKNFHPSRIYYDPFEQAPSRIATHRGDEVCRFHRPTIQMRQLLPSFDSVRLDPELSI